MTLALCIAGALVLGVALVGAVAFVRNADKAEKEVY